MIGTFSGERMIRLAAQFADHWNVWATVTGNSAANVPALQAMMDDVCRSMGRNPKSLGRSAAVLVDFDGAVGRPGQADPSLTGTPREIADEFLRYAEAGIDHLQVYPDPCTIEGFARVAEAVDLLDAE